MNADRVAYIKRKRSALKGEITKLRQSIDRKELDPLNVQLRVKRLSEHFHQYEELNIELAGLEQSEDAVEANDLQFSEVQNSFYELSTLAERMQVAIGTRQNVSISGVTNGFANSTFVEKQKSVKLPIADLPKFNGEYNEWISFKNEFQSLIGSRTDIDDVSKFIYLRNSLTGPAAKKLALLDATAENYKKGWDTLVSLYEKKRLLTTSHYNAIIELATHTQMSSLDDLSKLVDDAQQHLATLRQLGAVPDEGMIVCCLERALPVDVREEWVKTLTANVMPSFRDFYTFITDHVDRKHDLVKQANQASSSRKRSQNRESQGAKARRSTSGARSFVTGTAGTCSHCKQSHYTYRCPEFEKLNTQQRWDSVKASGACRNCLAFHKDACKSSHCKKCGKAHHTLLHSEKRGTNKIASNGKPQGVENQNLVDISKSA